MLLNKSIEVKLLGMIVICATIGLLAGCSGGTSSLADGSLAPNAIAPGGDDCLAGTGWWDPETGAWIPASDYSSPEPSGTGYTHDYGTAADDNGAGSGAYGSGSHSYGAE